MHFKSSLDFSWYLSKTKYYISSPVILCWLEGKNESQLGLGGLYVDTTFSNVLHLLSVDSENTECRTHRGKESATLIVPLTE